MFQLRALFTWAAVWVLAACAEPVADRTTNASARSLASGGFFDAGTMSVSRRFHTITSLGNGEFLIAGGGYPTGTTSVDVYSPLSGTLTPALPLPTPTTQHTATFLQEAKVLIAGGDPGTGPTRDTLLFDPLTRSWTPGPEMQTARALHTATLLPDGRLFVAGGLNDAGTPIPAAEVFDPVARTWTSVGTMQRTRFQHTATLLGDGRVLLVGGGSTSGGSIADVEIFDPDAGSFTLTTPMSVVRRRHTATQLYDGRVLVVAGRDMSGAALDTAELYDPADAGWSPLIQIPTAQFSHTAVLLPDGRVLITGGNLTAAPTSSASFFTPDAGSFALAPSLIQPRSEHAAVVLPAGDVLVCGGIAVVAGTRTCERISPQADFLAPAPLPLQRSFHIQELLADGTVLVAAGQTSTSVLGTSQLLTPGASAWVDAGTLTEPRSRIRFAALGDGRVLAVGGMRTAAYYPFVDSFDPVTRTWTQLPDLPDAGALSVLRIGRTVALDLGLRGAMFEFNPMTNTFFPTSDLPPLRPNRTTCPMGDGRVFSAGGTIGGSSSTLAHVYDGKARTWSAIPPMLTPREDGRCEVLPDGRVLAFGGLNNGALLANAEVYTPDAGWAVTGPLRIARSDLESVVLPSGRVLIHGGLQADGGSVAEMEVYEPGLGRFFAGPMSPVLQAGERVLLLPDGRVLIGRLSQWFFYDEGRGAQPEWTPTISPPAMIEPGATMTLTGTLLSGLSAGGSGGVQQEAASPLVVLHSTNVERISYLQVRSWSPSSVTVQVPPSAEPGVHWVHVVVGGVRSQAVPLRIGVRVGEPCAQNWECVSDSCAAGTCVGADGGVDAGAVTDAGVSPDAGAQPDAGEDGGQSDGGPSSTDGGVSERLHLDVGCGCAQVPVLAPLLFLFFRRRRSH